MRAQLTGAAVSFIYTLNIYLFFAHARLRCAHAHSTSNISTISATNPLELPHTKHGQSTSTVNENWHLVFVGVDAAILVLYSQSTIDCATEP